MTNETELAKSIDAARQAETIVNHPLFIASLATLREVTVERFENLGFSEVQQMQECNLRLNLIEEFEINLITIIQNGEIAFRTLEEIQTFKQEIKDE
jgi:hypothetical protein